MNGEFQTSLRKEVGTILSQARKRGRFSFSEAAKLLGVSVSELKAMESGSKAQPLDLVTKAIDIYGFGEDELNALNLKAALTRNKTIT